MANKINNWVWIGSAVAVVIALFYFMYAIADVMKILITSALIAYILDPIAVKLESRGMSRTTATLIIFLSLLLLLTGALIILLPALIDQISAIQAELSPEQATALFSRLDSFIVNKLSFLGIHNLGLSEKLQGAMVNAGD